MGGGDQEKDQKSVSFKHYSSEQGIPVLDVPIHAFEGATIHKLSGFSPAEHDVLFLTSND